MSPPIYTPDGTEVNEIVLPDGSTASEVVGPDGNVVFEAEPDIPDSVDYQALETSNTDNNNTLNGAVINPNVELSGINPTVGWNGGTKPADIVVFEGGISGTEVARKGLSSTAEGDKISVSVTMSAGTDYAIVGDNGGSIWTFDHDAGDTSMPITSDPDGDFDLVAGVDDGSQGPRQKAGFVDPIEEL
jgi:hypothetical protein